ncbi:MAG: hypothetical protein KC441_04330 [Anaerolineales bacterium]|nr:hypothetical protein [Anaerolineales bacterium]
MRFFDEMLTKYGFGDGEAVPDGAEHYREAYIRALNRIATVLGSGVRAFAYDRPSHNWCLLLFAPVAETTAFTEAELATGKLRSGNWLYLSEVGMDEPMQEAVAIANDAELDYSVSVVVSVNEAELDIALQYCHETAVARRDELNEEVEDAEAAVG